MQAAMRMRKLGRGQKVVIVGQQDVVDEVKRAASGFSVKSVLEWTVQNSIKATELAVVESAKQGLFYSTTKGKPLMAVEDEVSSLEELYGSSFNDVDAIDAVRAAKARHVSRTGGALEQSPECSEILSQIMERARRYGNHKVRTLSGTDEECERELELEQELEEEEECEIPRMHPDKENDWDISKMLLVDSPCALPAGAGVMSVSEFMQKYVSPKLMHIQWSGKVFGTRNFFRTVRNDGNSIVSVRNDYLRRLDVVVAYGSGEVVLLSEREANLLLELLWRPTAVSRKKVYFLHLSFLKAVAEGSIPGLSKHAMGLDSSGSQIKGPRWLSPINSGDVFVADDVLAELLLFAGHTNYPLSLWDSLEKLLTPPEVDGQPRTSACFEAEQIVSMRGFRGLLPCSNLEEVCRKIAHKVGDSFSAGQTNKNHTT